MTATTVREGRPWRQSAAPTCARPCVSGTRATITPDFVSAHARLCSFPRSLPRRPFSAARRCRRERGLFFLPGPAGTFDQERGS